MSGKQLPKNFPEVFLMCNNNCWWIIVLIVLFSCCGNGNGLFGGNSCGNSCGCGCDNDRCGCC